MEQDGAAKASLSLCLFFGNLFSFFLLCVYGDGVQNECLLIWCCAELLEAGLFVVAKLVKIINIILN